MTDDDRKQSWWGETQDFTSKMASINSSSPPRNKSPKRPATVQLQYYHIMKGETHALELVQAATPYRHATNDKNPWNPEGRQFVLRSLYAQRDQDQASRYLRSTKTSAAQSHKRRRARNCRRPSPTRLPNPHPAQVSPPVILTFEAVFQPVAECPQALPLDILVRVPHELHDALLQP